MYLFIFNSIIIVNASYSHLNLTIGAYSVFPFIYVEVFVHTQICPLHLT